MRGGVWLCVGVVILSLCGCSGRKEPQTYLVSGVVKEVTKEWVVIDHETVKDLLDAGVHRFPIGDAAILDDLEVGDEVCLELKPMESGLYALFPRPC